MSAGLMVVTGASRGIGAAIAVRAAASGYAVAVNYRRNRGDAEALVAGINAAGGKAAAIQADVARPDEVAHLFAAADAFAGPLRVLVNNAGIIGGRMPVADVEAATLAAVFATNVFGAFYCSAEAVRRMSRKQAGSGGTIVNISSAAARHGGLPHEAHYAASKSAIDGFTIALAKEAGPQGIRVNAVRPGLIETDIHEVHGGRGAVEALAPTIPLGRAGTPDEVAEAVVWLASEAAAYVHGAIIDVSGGR